MPVDFSSLGLGPVTSSGVTGRRLPSEQESTLSRVLDLVSRPGRATAGAIGAALEGADPAQRALENLQGIRDDDFADVLAQQGMEPGFARSALGFLGDVVIDPLNLVPVGAGTKVLGRGARLLGGAAEAGLQRVGLGALPAAVRSLGDRIGQTFVPYWALRNLPEYRDARRLLDSELSGIPARVVHEVAQRFKGTTPAQREAIQVALEKGPIGLARLDAIREAQAQAYEQMGERAVRAGVLRPEQLIENYTPYVRADKLPAEYTHPNSAFSARSRHARHRYSPDVEAAIEGGAERDAAVAAALRTIDAEKSARSAEFVQEAIRKFGKPLEEAGPGWRTIDTDIRAELPLKEQLKGVYFPAEIAEDLTKLFQPAPARNPLMELTDKGMRGWRTMATVVRPGFHITNLLGNIYNSAVAGLPLWRQPLRYLQASTRLMPERVGNYTRDKILSYFSKHGLDDAAAAFGDETIKQDLVRRLKDEIMPPSPASKLNPLSWPRRYVDMMSRLGGSIENASKRALFLDQLAKGKTLDEAMLATKDALFDYRELTPWERGMRNVLPFYTFTRKNIPIQLKSLIDRPATPAAYAKAKDALDEAAEEQGFGTPEALRPDYYQEQAYAQLPFRTASGAKVFMNPYLPFTDFNKLPVMGGNLEQAGQEWLSMISPVFKMPLELFSNRSFFLGRPLYDPERGSLRDLKPAPAVLQALPLQVLEHVPGVKVDERGRVMTPFLFNYAVEQGLPIAGSTGKAIQSMLDPGQTGNELNWAGFIGLPKLATQSREQEKAALKAAKRRDKRVKEAEKRERKLLSPEQARERLRKERINRLTRILNGESPQ